MNKSSCLLQILFVSDCGAECGRCSLLIGCLRLNADVSQQSRNRNVEICSQYSFLQRILYLSVVQYFGCKLMKFCSDISLTCCCSVSHTTTFDTEDLMQVTFSLLKGMFANVP